MKKAIFVLVAAAALTACGNAGTSNETTVDSAAVVVDTTLVDSIPGPGHVEAEEGSMLEGPGASTN